MYRTIRFFTDLQDMSHPYHVGDVYPRAGLSVSDERLAELSSADNKLGEPLIEKIVEAVPEVEAVEDSKPKGKRSRKTK